MSDFVKNPDWKTILLMGFILGFIAMGILSYMSVTKEVKAKKTECELNIPRNQKCVMQFVPEIKQTRG